MSTGMASQSCNKSQIFIRKAEPRDGKQIYKFMRDLCIFLQSGDDMTLSEDDFQRDLFSERPVCHCIVAVKEEEPNKILGYSLYYPVYSAWKGVTLYMEDLYVDAPYRGMGIGKLLWKRVTQIGLEMGCQGLRLAVENWNRNAKDWYVRQGCTDLTESYDEHLMGLTKDGMERLVKDS